MPGYMVEVEASGSYLKWMCEYTTVSKAVNEVFRTCGSEKIISIKLLKEKGK